jgi:hypothetical protein
VFKKARPALDKHYSLACSVGERKMPSENLETFFARMADLAQDPLTGLSPRCEVELSAIFAYRLGNQKIAWERVNPRFTDAKGGTNLADALRAPGSVLAEYPLFANSGHESDRWGQMKADAMFLSHDKSRVVLFEAKVDSLFTYGDSPPDAQLTRQLDYLSSLTCVTRVLVLLCPQFNSDWYWPRLAKCWNGLQRQAGMFACLVTWEDVLGANAS